MEKEVVVALVQLIPALVWPVLAEGRAATTTQEGVGGSDRTAVAPEVMDRLTSGSKVQGTIGDYPFLMHSAVMTSPRTGPKTGRYACRVWIEFDKVYGGFGPQDVKRVTYRLDSSFNTPNWPGGQIISTEASNSGFEAWLSLYGEFTILAAVEKVDGTVVWLARFLDLPGRPAD